MKKKVEVSDWQNAKGGPDNKIIVSYLDVIKGRIAKD